MTARQRCRQPSTRTSSERSADGFPEITTGGLVAENSTFPAPEYLMPCDSRFRGPLASADSLSIAVVSRNGTRPPLPAEIEWRLIRHPHEIGVRDQVLLFHGSGMAEEVGRFSAGSRGRVLPAVVLAPELDWGDVSRALSHGALSYLLENEYACLVTEALFCASAGTSILDPEIAAEQLRVARSARGGPNRCGCKEGGAHRMPERPKSLSGREREVMDLLASGASVRDIAKNLFLAEKTVRNYLARIYMKMEVHSQSEAILRWLGHLPPPSAGEGPPRQWERSPHVLV
ncbi:MULTISPECIES: response regulator transcription factor [unclassified Streptomyces]|uniref:response regulator transcription factor n=1 Tax=unclassified Streptomyces TaxID=2593676 RepID=UPI0022576A74|nr:MULTISPECIES: response regulator transcription factor [unclassified Streptomyces]MCX4878216.1 response regulator transcription factor [Streptomyces sp. NBC_00847]MCX5418219.1 response regulator transcription factor [Streptomyces sp. NBC_00078]